jgi:hypothetical protein
MNFRLTQATFYGAFTINIAGFCAVLCGGTLADWAAARFKVGRFYVLAGGLCLAAVFLLPFGLLRDANLLGICLLLAALAKVCSTAASMPPCTTLSRLSHVLQRWA